MIEIKSRMPNRATSTNDKIWWWIFPTIKIREEWFLVKTFWINSFCYSSLDSPDNLILTTIGNSKYTRHLRSIFCLIYCIQKKWSDIWRNEPEIPDDIKTNWVFDKFINQFRDSLTKQLEYSSNFNFWSFENIFFGKCPHAHIFDSGIQTKRENLFDIISSTRMTERYNIREFLSPSPIPIHDESYMFEHSVYKKVPREYQYQTEKQRKNSRFAFSIKTNRICFVELCFLLRVP